MIHHIGCKHCEGTGKVDVFKVSSSSGKLKEDTTCPFCAGTGEEMIRDSFELKKMKYAK